MKDKRGAVVIMPAHNEAANIAAVIAELRAHAPALDLVVINDSSTDQTPAIAERAGATVVTLPCNLGYGGAVQTGFCYAVQQGYRYGVLMDSDGQHNAGDVPRLLEMVQSGQADLALGSRFLGRLEYAVPWPKRLGMAVFRWMASRTTGQRFTDATSGFQAMTRDVMRFFARDNYPVDFPDADTIMTLYFAGFRVREAPVTMRARLSGESMHTTLKSFYYVLKMFLSIFIVWLRRRTNSQARRPEAENAA